jgi:hypothetical protein
VVSTLSRLWEEVVDWVARRRSRDGPRVQLRAIVTHHPYWLRRPAGHHPGTGKHPLLDQSLNAMAAAVPGPLPERMRVHLDAGYPAGALSDRLPRHLVLAVGLLFFAVGYLGLGRQPGPGRTARQRPGPTARGQRCRRARRRPVGRPGLHGTGQISLLTSGTGRARPGSHAGQRRPVLAHHMKIHGPLAEDRAPFLLRSPLPGLEVKGLVVGSGGGRAAEDP